MTKGKGKQTGNKGPGARPGAKGPKASGFAAPPMDEKLRGVSGGGTRGKAPAPPSGEGSKGGQPKDDLVTWAEGEQPWWVVSSVSFSVDCMA